MLQNVEQIKWSEASKQNTVRAVDDICMALTGDEGLWFFCRGEHPGQAYASIRCERYWLLLHAGHGVDIGLTARIDNRPLTLAHDQQIHIARLIHAKFIGGDFDQWRATLSRGLAA